MKTLFLVFFTFCFFIVGNGQNKKAKADEILKKAQEISFKKTDAVDNLHLEAATRYKVRKAKVTEGVIPSSEFQSKVWIQKDDGLKIKKLVSYPGNSFEMNEKTLSENKLHTLNKVKSPTDNGFVTVGFTEPGDPKQNEQTAIKKLKYDAFCLGFPVFFFTNENLIFDFVGVAKSGEQKTDVISTMLADTYQIRLFFDQSSHQLLLMTAKFTDPKTKEEIEHKYFFSDYKKVNGINFAHKIIMHENGEIVEERDIKQVELNQKLATDFFKTTK